MDYFAELVYDTLTGNTRTEFGVPGVKDMFSPGAACDRHYQRVLVAYEALKERLNEKNELAEVEAIISSMESIQRIIALEMYDLGMKIAKEKSRFV